MEFTYSVRYINHLGQSRITTLPIKTKGRGRKVQIHNAMTRIFGQVRVIQIAVARC